MGAGVNNNPQSKFERFGRILTGLEVTRWLFRLTVAGPPHHFPVARVAQMLSGYEEQ